ncbi:MAG: hypothetical protein ACOZAA_15975 [Pseudomonadota bacterium]
MSTPLAAHPFNRMWRADGRLNCGKAKCAVDELFGEPIRTPSVSGFAFANLSKRWTESILAASWFSDVGEGAPAPCGQFFERLRHVRAGGFAVWRSLGDPSAARSIELRGQSRETGRRPPLDRRALIRNQVATAWSLSGAAFSRK